MNKSPVIAHIKARSKVLITKENQFNVRASSVCIAPGFLELTRHEWECSLGVTFDLCHAPSIGLTGALQSCSVS